METVSFNKVKTFIIKKLYYVPYTDKIFQIGDNILYASIYISSILRKLGFVDRPVLTNAYYISTSKTGSEWLKCIFSNSNITKYSNMSMFRGRWIINNPSKKILPYTFTSSIGITYENYLRIPKSERYRSLYVYRDPRDILVSWYFSTLYSHTPTEKVLEYRSTLKDMDPREGLECTLNVLNETVFQQMRSWLRCENDNVMFISYEELIEDSVRSYRRIFDHFQWDVPRETLERVIERYSFQKQSGGRERGVENVKSHQRKGVPGDWVNHFDRKLCELFCQRNQDLLVGFHYEKDSCWINKVYS